MGTVDFKFIERMLQGTLRIADRGQGLKMDVTVRRYRHASLVPSAPRLYPDRHPA